MRTALGACWVVLTLTVACGPPPARVSLADARLAEGPVLVRGPDGHVLRYRFPQPAEGPGDFAASVFVRRAPDAAYYYFAGALQSSGSIRTAPRTPSRWSRRRRQKPELRRR